MPVAVWESKHEVTNLEVSNDIAEIWRSVFDVTELGVDVWEGWTVATSLLDLEVDYRTEVVEWEEVSEVTVLLLEPTTELVTWILGDTVAAEVDVSDGVPPDEEEVGWLQKYWWVILLGVVAIIIAIVVARRRV